MLQNELTIAWAIATSAREREHSIGVHFRKDCKEAEPKDFYDVIIARGDGGAQPQRRSMTN